MTNKATLLFAGAVVVAVAAALLAPEKDAPPAPANTSAVLPDGHPQVEAGAVAPTLGGPVATVLETLESGGYTYARVSAGGEEIWVAGPVTALEEGAEISLGGAMGMENFTAPSLDRTFESILFLNRFTPAVPGTGPAAASQSGFPEANQGTVLEVKHAAGYTYVRVDRAGEELWLAALSRPVEEGMTVAWSDGMVMNDFDSPTLGMTFDAIVFVDGLEPVEG